ncbi:sulfurtransferase TusA [Psychrobacter sp.]|uniref:sulfurtransferase TusA n=1 Tax=Psychrobacter sp. TaxID=56811 RepID=UPI003BAFED5B
MTTSTLDISINHHLDTQGLICPEPVMMLHKTIRKADGGDLIEIIATDPATTRDIPNFCRHLGHILVHQETLNEAPTYRYLVKKKSA